MHAIFAVAVVIAQTGCSSSEWHPQAPSTTSALGLDVIRAIDIPQGDAKIEQAISLLAQVLNDAEFLSAIMKGPSYHDVQAALDRNQADIAATVLNPDQTYAWNRVGDTGNQISLTNAQIVERLELAREPGGTRDHVVEFAIRRNKRPLALWCHWPFYREIGHRDPPNIVVTQDCKMDGMSAPELAGHWLHEYMHMLGFDHAYDDDPARKFSVPYFIGCLAVERAQTLAEGSAADMPAATVRCSKTTRE